ncbi:MAG: hypothetical protein ACUVRH_04795, partial [Candidatus Bipolaricaulia bacterium]
DIEQPAEALIKTYTSPTTVDWLVERARDPRLLERAGLEPGQATSLEAKKQGQFLQLSLQGSVPPRELEARLERVVAALEQEAQAELGEAIARRLKELGTEREAGLAQLREWEAELERLREAAEAGRARLQTMIAEIEADPKRLKLSVGVRATVQGYLVQKELDLLYARLQAVELALDEMDRLGLAYLPGVGPELVGLRSKLVALEAEEASLRAELPALPELLIPVRGPASSGPLGPGLKMSLAVAGVLGLFLGVLLAFFIHWLQAPARKEREDERP